MLEDDMCHGKRRNWVNGEAVLIGNPGKPH